MIASRVTMPMSQGTRGLVRGKGARACRRGDYARGRMKNSTNGERELKKIRGE